MVEAGGGRGHGRDRKCGRFPVTSLCKEGYVEVGYTLSPTKAPARCHPGRVWRPIPHLFDDCVYSTYSGRIGTKMFAVLILEDGVIGDIYFHTRQK